MHDKTWRRAVPSRTIFLAVMMTLSLALGGCAGGTAGMLGADSGVIGDERGGKIPGGVGEGGKTAASMRAVTAHCAQYGKKAFVTQMEAPAQGGLLAFVCLDR